jgi:hypothetical protein
MIGKVRKVFFFGKNGAKNFSIWGTGVETGTDPNDQSFFCFFFVHKKEDPVLSFPVPALGHP